MKASLLAITVLTSFGVDNALWVPEISRTGGKKTLLGSCMFSLILHLAEANCKITDTSPTVVSILYILLP
jgi:hypothetical protein